MGLRNRNAIRPATSHPAASASFFCTPVQKQFSGQMAARLQQHTAMKAGKLLDCSLLAAGVALTRFLFRSRYLYDLDSVNFALALETFDPELHQPHPPGYFLYVWLGRVAYGVIPEANAALVAVSIAASAAAAVAIYALADGWFGRRAAVFAGLIFLFSPLAWFHGTVALTYIVEVFFSALTGWLCWQVYQGRAGFVIPSAVVLAFAVGVRQSSILFLGPLWLFALRRAGWRRAVVGFAALGLGLLAWIVPMAMESGGLVKYATSLYDLWTRVPARRTAFSGSAGMAVATVLTRLTVIAAIYGLCFGAAGPLALLSRRGSPAAGGKAAFTWVWVGPALAFFTLVFLLFVNSGYLLVASPPVFAWAGARVAEWYSRSWRKGAALAAVAAAHTAVFLWAPLYCSYSGVRELEARLESAVAAVRAAARPEETLIVSFDSHFLGYRHAGYYLPEYWTVQYPQVGSRVFAMRNNQTQLLSRLPAPENFVFFPLPQGPSFEEYLQKLCARFPEGAVRRLNAGGLELVTGPSRELHHLFPQASTRVYAGR